MLTNLIQVNFKKFYSSHSSISFKSSIVANRCDRSEGNCSWSKRETFRQETCQTHKSFASRSISIDLKYIVLNDKQVKKIHN